MFFKNVLQDIDHDFAIILQIAARWCGSIFETVSACQVFEYEGKMKKNIVQTNEDTIEPWYIVNEVDWSYDDSRRFESFNSI